MTVRTSSARHAAGTERRGSGSFARMPGPLARYRWSWPVAVYIAAHGAMMAVVWFILAQTHYALIRQLQEGDGGWYAAVAQLGYESRLVWQKPGVPAQMRIEFFPLYPLTMRAVSDVTTLGPAQAGLLISLAASLVAAAGIYAVVCRYASHAVALATVGLWAALPTAFFQSMDYTEALFTALSAWALYALLRSRWLTAAALTVAAGLTRPSAVALIAVVCLASLLAAIRNDGRWRAIPAILVAPLGVAGYVLFIGLRLHNLRAWFISVTAPGWNNKFDFGKYTFMTFRSVFEIGNRGGRWELATDIVAVYTVICVAAACIIALDRRVPLELRAWTWIAVLFTLGSANTWIPMPRFLMPLFPVLVPAATVYARASRRNQVILAATVMLISGWWGAYFLQTPGIGLLPAAVR
jgi:hypothetical protein